LSIFASCHPEEAAVAQRGIWASRALRRTFCEAIVAHLPRITIRSELEVARARLTADSPVGSRGG